MNLKDLEYFHQVVKLNSFTKVSQLFNISQPTISYSVKRLEEELKTQLIIREKNHHSILITESGKLLDYHIGIILTELEIAQVRLKRLSEQIIFGLPPIIANQYFSKISVELLQTQLIEELTITSQGSKDMLNLLKHGKVDIALIGSLNEKAYPHIEVKLLTTKSFMIIVSPRHALAKKKSLLLSDLVNEKFVLFNEHYVHSTAFEQLYAHTSFRPKILNKTDDLNILKRMIKEEIGIGYLTEIAIDESDQLVAIPLKEKNQPIFHISLAYQKPKSHTNIFTNILNAIENIEW